LRSWNDFKIMNHAWKHLLKMIRLWLILLIFSISIYMPFKSIYINQNNDDIYSVIKKRYVEKLVFFFFEKHFS
jgi:hypothetical protein